jgi:soluble lytic murein transglycosylase-like protein
MPICQSFPTPSRKLSFALFSLPLVLTAVLRFGGPSAADASLPTAEPTLRAAAKVPSPRRSGASRYDPIIHEYAVRYAVDPALVKAVMRTESGFRERSESPSGARGLMQVMPRTGRAYGARDLYDPEQNVRAGVRHLRYLLERHDNDPRLAVAAYNAGSSVVERYGGVPPYRETRHYVARVMRLLHRYRGQMKTTRTVARVASNPVPSNPKS